jgi:NAD(P)-dependent dehydrogenase (short-subunit alcohol dehydrogenase family)
MLADIEKGALDAALASLEGIGPETRGVVCDVADPASVDNAAETAFAALGNIHILCNNAGVGARGGIDDISLANCRWVLDVHLMGVVHGLRSLLPHIRAHGEGGHIVNTASVAGIVNARQGFAPYPASKFAVVAMSEGLALELQPLGIGVTVLCPGWVRTRIMERARNRPERYGPNPVSSAASPVAAQFAELVRLGWIRGMSPHECSPRSATTSVMCSLIQRCAVPRKSVFGEFSRRSTRRLLSATPEGCRLGTFCRSAASAAQARSARTIASHSSCRGASDGVLPARRYQPSAFLRSPSTRCR